MNNPKNFTDVLTEVDKGRGIVKSGDGVTRSRKIANNTYLVKYAPDKVSLRLHKTDVITYEPKHMIITSGGWRTPTTKDRINNGLPAGISIHQYHGDWFLASGGNPYQDKAQRTAFFDGMRISYSGDVLNDPTNPGEQEQRQKIKKMIDVYVKGFSWAKCGPWPQDNPEAMNGDCWYCLMQTTDGKSLGDATGDTSHLISHLEEKYYMHSLNVNAIKHMGARPDVYYELFKRDAAHCGDMHTIKRFLRRYLKDKLLDRTGEHK